MVTAYGSHVTDQYGTQQRTMLDEQLLAARLYAGGFVGETPHYSRVTTSTQDVARQLYEIGKRPPYSVVTDEQTAGRGRLARSWEAPPGGSVLLTVAMPLPSDPTAVPLCIGVTVLRMLQPHAPMLRLKWPNDIVVPVHAELRKLGGLIAEVHGDALLVGIGLNIDLHDDELPTPQAVSFRQLGTAAEREQIIADIVVALSQWERPTLDEYRQLCVTLGEPVVVSLTNGTSLDGTASAVTNTGALVVDGVEVAAGDVQHVRSI